MAATQTTTMTQDDVARRIASSLAYYVYLQRDEVDVPTVLRMYDWVREIQVDHEHVISLPVLARRWEEHQRGPDDTEWLMRAFE
jgi:hypothetical protein